jgi:hypothetical protein
MSFTRSSGTLYFICGERLSDLMAPLCNSLLATWSELSG